MRGFLLWLTLPVLLTGLLLGCSPDEPPPEATAAPTVAVVPSATAKGGPVVAAATPEPGACGSAPAGWRPYVVQPGDTLQGLSARAGVSSARIVSENCLTGDMLIAGDSLYLPTLAASTPCVAGERSGWEAVTLDIGDTLVALALARGTTVTEIMAVNCLVSDAVSAGEQLYLPALPTPTACPPPPGWQAYQVQPGDTLLSLAAARNVTVAEIVAGNCLPARVVRPGDSIYLPPPPTPTPVPPTVAPAPVAGPTQPPQAVASNNVPGAQGQQSSAAGGGGGAAQGDVVSVIDDLRIAGLISPIDISPRQPNDSQFRKECKTSNDPSVEFLGHEASLPLVLGQRRYFFICHFAPITATLTFPNRKSIPLNIEQDPEYPIAFGPSSNLDYTFTTLGVRQESTPAAFQDDFSRDPSGVIEWVALPYAATGNYTLTVTGEFTRLLNETSFEVVTGLKSVSTTFAVVQPNAVSRTILIDPIVGDTNTQRMIYFSNYPLGSNPNFRILYTPEFIPDGPITPKWYTSDKFWTISISKQMTMGQGWGSRPLALPSSSAPGTYLITSTNLYSVATGPFWVK